MKYGCCFESSKFNREETCLLSSSIIRSCQLLCHLDALVGGISDVDVDEALVALRYEITQLVLPLTPRASLRFGEPKGRAESWKYPFAVRLSLARPSTPAF